MPSIQWKQCKLGKEALLCMLECTYLVYSIGDPHTTEYSHTVTKIMHLHKNHVYQFNMEEHLHTSSSMSLDRNHKNYSICLRTNLIVKTTGLLGSDHFDLTLMSTTARLKFFSIMTNRKNPIEMN
jgi:hypothetical protein